MLIKGLSPGRKMSEEQAKGILRNYFLDVRRIEKVYRRAFGRVKWMINPPGEYLRKVQGDIRSLILAAPPGEDMGDPGFYRDVELLDRRINTLLDNKRFPKRAGYKTCDLE